MAEAENPLVQVDRFPPLTPKSFTRVAPAYRTWLRLQVLPWVLVSVAVWWFVPRVLPDLATDLLLRGLLSAIPVGLVLLVALVWAPRRYARTGYCVRAEDLHLRTGALWQRTTSVTLNRIQHLEINQGPLERVLGIARLMVFTAGGSGYDLMLPGLPAQTAERLKAHLLERIAPQPATEAETRPEANADDPSIPPSS